MSKNPFFSYWYRNLLFFKISHSAHSDKILLLWIVLLDHLILNCMELLPHSNPTRRLRDCALIMADIPIDRFALSRTLVHSIVIKEFITATTTKVYWQENQTFISVQDNCTQVNRNRQSCQVGINSSP